ncbi:unnamed protein product [Phytophthora lilii]|uniref:Unnamed protein product n=1 Tax=Phytophthora lilii TaxID=2077276 RepID=A0A9W6TCT2_9STRA|nr:unnamed protein product [Phytophthora lilii]
MSGVGLRNWRCVWRAGGGQERAGGDGTESLCRWWRCSGEIIQASAAEDAASGGGRNSDAVKAGDVRATDAEADRSEPVQMSASSSERRKVVLRKDEFGRDVEVVVEEKRHKSKRERKDDGKERKHKHKHKKHKHKSDDRSRSPSPRGRLVGTPPPPDPFRPQDGVGDLGSRVREVEAEVEAEVEIAADEAEAVHTAAVGVAALEA